MWSEAAEPNFFGWMRLGRLSQPSTTVRQAEQQSSLPCLPTNEPYCYFENIYDYQRSKLRRDGLGVFNQFSALISLFHQIRRVIATKFPPKKPTAPPGDT